ncbi:MAG: DUF4097 family beta strand repeat-containing protein [Anaerolineales bacterium]
MSENIEKTFSVASPARLSVSNIRGSVEIHPGEDGVIQVTAIKQHYTGDEKRTGIEINQEADGTVKAATRFPDGGWNWLFGSQPCEVDYVVKAPRQCSLKLNGVSNTVLAEGFEGAVSVNSVSGEITLRDLTGSVRIHTVSGEADGDRIAGSLSLDTVSGDVALKESAFSSIKANTVSGDMRIRTSLTEGPYDFKSVSGQVRLTVPPDTHCTGELHSVSGDLVSAFPVTGYSRQHGSQMVNVQGGGVKISLNSVSGDLSLDCDGEIPPAPEPLKTFSSEERRAVLERVERGELTVDEALGHLHA